MLQSLSHFSSSRCRHNNPSSAAGKEDALKNEKNSDYTVKVFPKANHLFLAAKSRSPKEYGTLKKEFIPGFLETMSEWILRHLTIPR
jgi:hypothetical protein